MKGQVLNGAETIMMRNLHSVINKKAAPKSSFFRTMRWKSFYYL